MKDNTYERSLRPENPQGSFKSIMRLLSYLKDYKFRLGIILFLIIITAIVQVTTIYSLKFMINDYIVPLMGVNNPDFSQLFSFVVFLAAVHLTGVLANFTYQKLLVNVSSGILNNIRIQLFNHMQKLPIRFYDTHAHGEIMSVFTNDTDTLREFYSNALPNIISSGISWVGIFTSMITLNKYLSLLTVGVLVVMIVTVYVLSKRTRYYFKEVQQSVGVANGYLEEMIEGQRVIKVFNHEKQTTDGFEGIVEKVRLHALGAHTYSNLLIPIMINLSYLHFAITAMVGALLTINPAYALDLGTLASFLQFTRNFGQPISQISQQLNTVMRALAGADRIFMILDSDPESNDGLVTLVHAQVANDGTITESAKHTGTWAWKISDGNNAVYTLLEGDIEFKDVFFGYDPEVPVLKDINIYAKPGQKIALVGSTGAGKTTITNLLNRFYDIDKGVILFDGIDIMEIDKRALRGSLSMVLQDTHLFTGTIADNIRYGNLNATQHDIVEASQLANADSFIDSMPQRYETHLSGDGGNLSQGQRQLINISRAAVADPPVLVLDEATSSIDTRTEALITVGMAKLMEGRTSFVIAHRLSTIMDSDVILVLEDGRIIERGSHDKLVEQGGRYYQLYTGAIDLV